MAWRAILPDEPLKHWQSLALGAGLAGAATLVRMAISQPLGHELPFITYFPALIAAAALGGGIGGGVCLLLSTILVWVLFLPGGAPPGWAVGSYWLSGGMIVIVGAALADSVREMRRSRRKLNEAQAKLQMLVSELAHRNRNALTVIMSIVSQSARHVSSAGEAVRIINERLDALARAQQLVLERQGDAVPLRALVEAALAPFGLERVTIAASPDIHLDPDLAAPLGLVLHELATNAVKYGGLLPGEGRVWLEWKLESGTARLLWRETGLVSAEAPMRKGFGTRLLGAALTPHGGKVERSFDEDGLSCELQFPATSAAAARNGQPRKPVGEATAIRAV